MFREMTEKEIIATNGGKTYVCPCCYRYKGSYWSVYGHVLNGCYKNNKYLKALGNAGFWCLKKGLIGMLK